ncbi:hypothetical protein E4T47_08821 [Aureobasidium subglaciale]|nr:hypothetical protein E4T47_08821 [Aureobasidium subglaciale]
MEGNGGRSGRRNDSISSVMSLGADNNSSSWTDDSNNNDTPATQRSSRAENTQMHELDHETSVHMISQFSPEDASYTDASSNIDTESDIDMLDPSELRHHILELLDELPATCAIDFATPYQRAAMLPPVTQDSLCELDVGRIINNPKLRHDVNFDRELHFRPNLDGSRGKLKLKSADEYWKALLAELVIYKAVGERLRECKSADELEYYTFMIKANQMRLPGVFSTIYEILKTLVPDRDQAIVAERLDVDMIMQQICKGVFNLLDLAQWLASILKAHCAPMRDDWIDSMLEQTTRGVDQEDQNAIVIGLRQTLAILEAMKLDVANHQIRHLRSLLIDDTVNFQQKYHLHKIAANRFKLESARSWFKQEESLFSNRALGLTPLEIFSSAVLRSLLSQDPPSHFPETFHLDAERLRILRSDLHSLVQMDMCCNAFDVLIKDKIDDNTRLAARKSLQANIADIIGESRLYLENLENISAQIVRLVLQLEGATAAFDSDMMSIVEHHLRAELPFSSSAFGVKLEELFSAQFPRLRNAINSSTRHNLLALHDAMLPPTQPAGKCVSQKVISEPPMDEVLKRVTHLAILHWHVWAAIVYDVQGEGCLHPLSSAGNEPDTSEMNANTTSPSPLALSPEMKSQGGGFTQPSGPSITNSRSQK